MHFRHRQTDRQTDSDIVYIHILHLALKIVYLPRIAIAVHAGQ